MKTLRKEPHDMAKKSSQSLEIEEKTVGKGLTQRQKNILGETKRRHDKALRKLAQM